MKNILIITALGCLFACSNVHNVDEKKVITKSILSDTITVNYFGTDDGPKKIRFDSSFVVESIQVSYPGHIPADNRMAVINFYDNGASVVSIDTTSIYTTDKFIGQFLHGNQSITYSDLNQSCDSLDVWFQAYQTTHGTFKIIGHYSSDDDFEVVNIDLTDDVRENTLTLIGSHKIKSIKAQSYSVASKSFKIINNDSTINISDTFSVTNIKDYTPNQTSSTVTFKMISPVSSEYGFASFVVVVEK